MPETAVKEALSARYDLRPVDGLTGVLVVREKATPVTLGSINFSKGRLVMVTEDWDSVDRSEAAIGMLLFKTLSELTTSQVGQWHGASKCDVGTARSDEPRADYVQMIVRCGEKTVKLTLQQLIGYSGTLSIQVQTGELPER
jgi:hypothetical protein